MGPLIGLAAWALLRRARRTPGDAGAGMRLAAYAGFGCSAAFFACLVVGMSGGDTEQIGVLENCAVVVLGVAAWIGIVRYGLFDTRVVVSRALVYGALTLVVVGVYVGVVVVIGQFAGGLVPQAVATAVAVLAALPLRDVLQRRANHLVYGFRDEPASAMARLGERLDAAGAPQEALGAAARTVAEALRLSYVGVEVDGRLVASSGRLGPEPVREIGLPFAGETIGLLSVQTRHDDFSRSDEALLADLARQVAVVAHAVSLTDALRHSRERVVSLREEERRRLRRDLHDGLGPTLAGIALGIDTVRRGLAASAAASPVAAASPASPVAAASPAASPGLPASVGSPASPGSSVSPGLPASPGSSASPGSAASPGLSALVGSPASPDSPASVGLPSSPGSSVSPGSSASPGSSVSPGSSASPGSSVSPGLPAPAASLAADRLAALRLEAERAVDDIRRIVYDLRPPVLDELGLEGAVREQAARLGGAVVEVLEPLPPLPAAVEVAAYRIAVEALANAHRHASGAPVTVSLSLNGGLRWPSPTGERGYRPDSGPGWAFLRCASARPRWAAASRSARRSRAGRWWWPSCRWPCRDPAGAGGRRRRPPAVPRGSAVAARRRGGVRGRGSGGRRRRGGGGRAPRARPMSW